MTLKKILRSLLIIKQIRYFYGKIRFVILKKTHGIKRLNENGMIRPETLDHNKSALKNIWTDFNMIRSSWLVHLLLSLEQINKKSKILIIGPRTENEILHLEGHGFENIEAVDLISYSKKIKLQDMHNLKFNKNNFDIVLIGWTLSYSSNPKIVLKNIINVLKDRGLIIIGVQFAKKLSEESKFSKKDRINSIKQIEELLDNNLSKTIFQNEAPLKKLNIDENIKFNGLSGSNIVGCFEIKK
jgi:hypothetical protein